MAQIPGSLAEAQEMYALYIAAEKKVMGGQEYYIRDRRLRMADMAEICKWRDYWLARINALNPETGGNGGITVTRFLPVDD
jgi:ribosomal protein L20